MSGPAPAPSAHKQLRGNPGRRRLNDAEPQAPALQVVTMPEWLRVRDGYSVVVRGLTVKALRQRARELSVPRYTRLSRDELREALVAAHQGPRELAWGYLVGIFGSVPGLMTSMDEPALGLMVDAYADYVDAQADVDRHGAHYQTEGRNGIQIKPHPAVGRAQDAWKRFASMIKEFGGTPSARTRIRTDAPPPPSDEADEWMD